MNTQVCKKIDICNRKTYETLSMKIYEGYFNFVLAYLCTNFKLYSHDITNDSCFLIIESDLDIDDIKNLIKQTVKFYKNQNLEYISKHEEALKNITIFQKDNNDNKQFRIRFKPNKFKYFIVFLMKEYNLTISNAYNLYRKGLNDKELSISLKDILGNDDCVKGFKSLYKNNSDKLEQDMFAELFYDKFFKFKLDKAELWSNEN